jgi:hypothetical protein
VRIFEDSLNISRIILILIQKNTITEVEINALQPQLQGIQQNELIERLITLKIMKIHHLQNHYQYKSPIITTITLSKDQNE